MRDLAKNRGVCFFLDSIVKIILPGEKRFEQRAIKKAKEPSMRERTIKPQ